MVKSPKVGDALQTIEKTITQKRINLYANASGDFNPIHIDHKFAATSQFGRTISHGMMSAAAISEIMTIAFPDAWPQNGRMKIRFRAPVYPGETVKISSVVKSVRVKDHLSEITCTVLVTKPDGQAAINGDTKVTLVS